jgi:hypothetical protein
MKLTIGKRTVSVTAKNAIGKGGEADIFDLHDGTVAKVFKNKKHPDLLTQADKDAAERRIDEHQLKLPAFPKGLPSNVAAPLELATNSAGRIVGYVMRMIEGAEMAKRIGEPTWRNQGGDPQLAVRAFTDLHSTVKQVHEKGIVIGDFNNLNIMIVIATGEAVIIDADSFQFGNFPSRVFTEKFVDPILCDPSKPRPSLIRQHNQDSDWFAFSAMLMESLICVGPWGGIYRPSDKSKRIPHTARPLKRVTVFDPEVTYPRPATPYDRLPDEILHYFHEVFEKDLRQEFPSKLITDINWITCDDCGTAHARRSCPECLRPAPSSIKEQVAIVGNLKSTRKLETKGIIVYSCSYKGNLLALYYDNGKFRREDGQEVASGSLDPSVRYRLDPERTMMARKDKIIIFHKTEERRVVGTSMYRNLFSSLGVSEGGFFWIRDGNLVRESSFGADYGSDVIGQVMGSQTLFWVGGSFGFGFYNAGEMSVAFVFDVKGKGINDSVELPRIPGKMTGARCVFSGTSAFLFIASSEGGVTVHRCIRVYSDGKVEEIAQGEEGDGTWMGDIHGKCALGPMIFSATDDGLLRTDIKDGQVSSITTFQGSSGFVHSGCHLLPGRNGLHVIDNKGASFLEIVS